MISIQWKLEENNPEHDWLNLTFCKFEKKTDPWPHPYFYSFTLFPVELINNFTKLLHILKLGLVRLEKVE